MDRSGFLMQQSCGDGGWGHEYWSIGTTASGWQSGDDSSKTAAKGQQQGGGSVGHGNVFSSLQYACVLVEMFLSHEKNDATAVSREEKSDTIKNASCFINCFELFSLNVIS